MEAKLYNSCKHIIKSMILIQLLLTLTLLVITASIIFNLAKGEGPSFRSLIFSGAEVVTGGSGTYIDTPYEFDLSNSDWSITTVARFDDLGSEGQEFDHSLVHFKDNAGGNSVNMLLHLNQFGGIPYERDYLGSFFQGSQECIIVGGLSEDFSSVNNCGDNILHPEFDAETSFELEEGEWYFIALTHDNDLNKLDYYINGQLIQSIDYDIPSTGVGRLLLGVQRNLDRQFFEGLMAQFRLFSEVLNSEDIFNWYNNGDRPDRNLEIEYLFQQSESSSVIDSSGNGFNGQIINDYTWSEEAPMEAFVGSQVRRSERSSSNEILFTPPPPISISFIDDLGDGLEPGDELELKWTYNRDIFFVNIYYSVNDGESWEQIAKWLPARDRAFSWTLPSDFEYDSLQFKVAGTDLAIDFIDDTSNSYAVGQPENIENIDGEASLEGSDETGESENTDSSTLEPKAEEYPSPVTGELEPVNRVVPGTLIQGKSFEAVYLVDENHRRRPIFQWSIIETYDFLRENVNIVTDATLASMPLGEPVLPRPGSSLLKFDSISGTFISETDDLYKRDLLVEIPKTDKIMRIMGPTPEDFTLMLPVTFFRFYGLSPNVSESELEARIMQIIN